jgi:hypothetical protein
MHEIGAEVVGRILDHHAEIFEMERITQRRFHADIAGDPDKDDGFDPARTQNAVELRIEKGTVPRFMMT